MQPETNAAWLTDRDLAVRYNVHRITIWRWSREGRLPKPRKLTTQTSRWSAAEIERHDASILQNQFGVSQ